MQLPSAFFRHPGLWTAGVALSSLPIGVAARLIEGPSGTRVLKALGRAGLDETAARLLLHHLSTPPEGAAFEGVVLIAGLPRIGKSTLARKVADTLHMRTLSTDDLASLYTGLPKKEAYAARCRLLSQICKKARGLVLEGKGLIPALDAVRGHGTTDLSLDPDRLHSGAIRVHAVGCCDSSAESWETALRAHGGWVTERGEDYLLQFATRRCESNRRLRDRARAAAIPYFEIPRENFTAAVDRTVAMIIAELRQGATH